ncbi:hypothetical protein LTS18_004494 [Coniosporium uncinatum]|uniref:Uncharacterized protein n=1 Tax=Coniosporium uncinatum TaxID=93489 RepID=A0ACC3DD24_9PEZI|nr:hypothetical protein LTS18_004494 [Coniosporium uncinatum]
MASFLHQGDCTLIPVNLEDPNEITELLRQRKICGWNYERSSIEQWNSEINDGTRSMFWITALIREDVVKAGHIALASTCSPPDPELADPDKSVMTISTFFILPEHRGLGLGRDTMDVVESLATREPYGAPHCRAIVVDTLDRRYWELDEEGWRGWWAKWGQPTPEKGRSNEDWYRRRGYIKFKERPKYTNDLKGNAQGGAEEGGRLLIASYLRKELQ